MPWTQSLQRNGDGPHFGWAPNVRWYKYIYIYIARMQCIYLWSCSRNFYFFVLISETIPVVLSLLFAPSILFPLINCNKLAVFASYSPKYQDCNGEQAINSEPTNFWGKINSHLNDEVFNWLLEHDRRLSISDLMQIGDNSDSSSSDWPNRCFQ